MRFFISPPNSFPLSWYLVFFVPTRCPSLLSFQMVSSVLTQCFSISLRSGYEPGGWDIALLTLGFHLRLCTSSTSTTAVRNHQQPIVISEILVPISPFIVPYATHTFKSTLHSLCRWSQYIYTVLHSYWSFPSYLLWSAPFAIRKELFKTSGWEVSLSQSQSKSLSAHPRRSVGLRWAEFNGHVCI